MLFLNIKFHLFDSLCAQLYFINSNVILSSTSSNTWRCSLPSQNIYIYGAQIYTTYHIYVYIHESIYLNRTKQILEYRKETFDSRGMSTINGTVIIAHKIDVKRKWRNSITVFTMFCTFDFITHMSFLFYNLELKRSCVSMLFSWSEI